MSVTLTRFGTLVIIRSSMLLPRVGFFFIKFACQEVVVKVFNKDWFVNTRCAVNGVPEDVWQIKKSPEITILSNWSQTQCRKLSNTSIQLGSSLDGLYQKQNKIL